MKSSLTKTIVAILACAASAGGGYWYGHVNAAAPAAKKTASAKPRSNKTGGLSAILVSGQNGEAADWQSLLKASGKLNADLLAAWARNLSPEEALAALKSLKDQPASSRRNDIMGALYNSWAERDPQNFLAATGEITVPRLRESSIDAALKAMAAQDPKAALQWIKDNPGTASTSATQERFASAMAGYAAADPDAALAAVNALSDSDGHDRDLKSAAMKAVADVLTDQGQFSQVATLFGQLPAGQSRDDAYTQLAQTAAEVAPQDAASWVATLTDPQQRNTMGVQVAKAWAANDPSAAATWAAQMDQTNSASADPNNPQAAASGQLLASAIQSWASYDLDAPADFLNQLPSSPAKDSSVAIFALSSSQEDPASAIQWVSTITNSQMQTGVALGVSLQWMQQDPAAFNQFLSTTTVLTDQQKQILTSIPPDMAQRLSKFNSAMGGGNALQNLMQNAIINGGMMGPGQGGAGAGPGGTGGGAGQGGGFFNRGGFGGAIRGGN